MTAYDDIAAQLDALVEALDELAFDRLREAAAERHTQRPAVDKQLTQARRAIEKAAHLLRGIDSA